MSPKPTGFTNDSTVAAWFGLTAFAGALLALFSGYAAAGGLILATMALGGLLALVGRPAAQQPFSPTGWAFRPRAIDPQWAERITGTRTILLAIVAIFALLWLTGLLLS